MNQAGTLIVKPQTAKLIINTEHLGRMDPYCTISIGSTSYTTSVAHDQHQQPHWSESFTFKVNNDQSMKLTMLDKDHIKKDSYIGDCLISLSDIYLKGGACNWYELKKDGKPSGEVMITFEFFGDKPQAGFQPNPQWAAQQATTNWCPPNSQISGWNNTEGSWGPASNFRATHLTSQNPSSSQGQLQSTESKLPKFVNAVPGGDGSWGPQQGYVK